MLPEQLFQRDILHGDIGGVQNIAAAHGAGNARAHIFHVFLRHAAGSHDRLCQGCKRSREALRPPEIKGRALHSQDLSVFVHQAGFQVGAAYVNANVHILSPPKSLIGQIFPLPRSARRSTRCARSRAAL